MSALDRERKRDQGRRDGCRIRCPVCRTVLPSRVSGTSTDLRCPGCGARFPVEQGVVDLTGDSPGPRSLAQLALECEPMVRVYEGPLWRLGPLLAAAFGIDFEREFELVAEAVALAPGQCLLDLACGPGLYARRLARREPGAEVVGVDLSRPMLRYAARRSASEDLRNLTWIHADALDLPFADSQLDAVVCAGAIHLFRDVPGVLREVRRVLEPGGRFAVVAIRRSEGPIGRLRARIQRGFTGIDAFSEEQLGTLLEGAGFGQPTCLHSSRLLLVMRTARPQV